jgi:hypothetical protein
MKNGFFANNRQYEIRGNAAMGCAKPQFERWNSGVIGIKSIRKYHPAV